MVVSSVLTLRGGVAATVTTKHDLYGRSCRNLRGSAFQVLELGGRGMVSLDVQTRPTGFGAILGPNDLQLSVDIRRTWHPAGPVAVRRAADGSSVGLELRAGSTTPSSTTQRNLP